MENVGKVGKAIAGGLALAGAGAVAFGVSAVKSFNDSEKSIAQLDAVLKSTNNVAGITRDRALELASALQKTTTFSDEAVLGAENLLLTFTNIKDDVFPDATKTVLDMSTALGQDTKSSAVQLGKALQDPINGITALRRVGVNFTEDQQKQIQTLVESGKTMEAQKLILKELGTEFGGSAQAQAGTFAGKIEQMKNQFDDLKEVMGEQIVIALSPAMDEFSKKLNDFASSDEGKQQIKDLTQAFITFGTAVAKAIGFVIKSAQDLGTWIGVTSVVIEQKWDSLVKKTDDMAKKMKSVFTGLRDFMNGLWNGIGDAFYNAVKPIADKIDKMIARYNDLPGTPNISEIRLQRQFGGGVNAGTPYVVGEKRPEVFVPSQSGNIKQMNQVGGGSVEVTFNNVNVRNDNDLDYIIRAVRETLGRDTSLASMGVKTY